MDKKRSLVAGLIVALLLALLVFVLLKPQAPQAVQNIPPAPPAAAAQPVVAANAVAPASNAPTTHPAVDLQEARDALELVGTDVDAEMLWVRAINDPGLSANDRSDLIEDLNDHGVPREKDVTAKDLPIIKRRMQIIHEHASAPMDDVNAAAFAEAYKDLSNMLILAGEQPAATNPAAAR